MSDVNDETKAAVEVFRRAAKRLSDRDPFRPMAVVLLAHIDSFDARLAAAREEQRAVDLARLDHEGWDHIDSAAQALRDAETRIKAAALTSTPLADQLRDEREVSDSLRAQLIAAEAERDRIGVRLRQLESHNVYLAAERDALRAQLLAERERMELWLTAPDGKQYERGTVQDVFDELDTARAQQADADACIGALRANDDALRAQVAKLEADQHCPTCGSSVYTCVDCDVTPLRAQVEAARRFIEDDTCRHHEEKAEFLAAMDEAKP